MQSALLRLTYQPAALQRAASIPGPQPGEAAGQRTLNYITDVPPVAVVTRTGQLPASLFAERAQRPGFHRILYEGGPILLDQLIAADLVDEICLTISPTLAGDSTGPRPGALLDSPARMSLRHAVSRDDYVFLRYSRIPAELPA
jgi:riboflavin biosynthesis pyrimidine reductase